MDRFGSEVKSHVMMIEQNTKLWKVKLPTQISTQTHFDGSHLCLNLEIMSNKNGQATP